MTSLLESLVIASEKAGNIARVCRQDRHLFGLLVQEKDTNEANPRFVRDFKTLADVLIQEALRHDVGRQFPEVRDFIRGEESYEFRNKLGETIKVEVLDSKGETRDLLAKVLNSDAATAAATLLAEEVHRKLAVANVNTERDIPEIRDLDINELGIWIDPIDSTSEYINGTEKRGPKDIFSSGLRCVTVLIGVYNRFTGSPIMGVVNQPFHEERDGEWRGKCYWGINNNFMRLDSERPMILTTTESKVICVSGSEDASVIMKLREEGYVLVEAAGAGYKLLLVVLGLADAYVLTKNSTFKWDTCAPQAILNGSGGDLVVWDEAIGGKIVPVDYKDDATTLPEEGDNKIDRCCNRGGIIAYRNENVLRKLTEIFRKSEV